MRKNLKHIICALLMLATLPLLSGCNDEDDVVNIFVGKTWKLSYIAAEGSNKQFDFWNGNEAAREKSLKALGETGNYVLNFVGSDMTNTTGGAFTGKAISALVDGKWTADGKTNTLKLSTKITGTESDLLAKAFLSGLQNAVSYKGDINNLFIYYKQGQTTLFMGFKPQK